MSVNQYMEATQVFVEPTDSRNDTIALSQTIKKSVNYKALLNRELSGQPIPKSFSDTLELLDRDFALSGIDKGNQDFAEESYKSWWIELTQFQKDYSNIEELRKGELARQSEGQVLLDNLIEARKTFFEIYMFNELVQTYSIGDKSGLSRMISWTDYPATHMAMRYIDEDFKISDRLVRNPGALEALSQLCDDERQKLKSLDSFGERSHSLENIPIDLPDPPCNITGLNQPSRDGFKTIVDQKLISDFLRSELLVANTIPPILVMDIDQINFIDTNTGRSTEYLTGETNPGLRQLDLLDLQREIFRTIVHEIFEGAVHKMTYKEMQDYELSLTMDSSQGAEMITGYVRRARYKLGNPDKGMRLSKKEDFCESAALFVTSPHELYLAAPHRYSFMLDYFAGRLDESKRPFFYSFNRFMINEMSDPRSVEVVRERMLKHHDELENIYTDDTRWIRQGHLEMSKDHHELDQVKKYNIPIEFDLQVPTSLL